MIRDFWFSNQFSLDMSHLRGHPEGANHIREAIVKFRGESCHIEYGHILVVEGLGSRALSLGRTRS